MAGSFEFSVITSEGGFRALAGEWTDLYNASHPRNPFLSHPWTEGSWAARRHMGSLFIVACRDRGTLVGIAPIYRQRRAIFRVLRFIGDGSSDYLGFLRAGDRPEVTPALIGHLQALEGEWDLAFLRGLSPAYADRLDAKPSERLRCETVMAPPAPHLRFAGDWDELLRSGPSQIRHTRRWARKFEREGGTVARLCGASALEVLDDLVEVEANSWKKSSGIAWFDSPGKRRLLAHALAACDGIEVWLGRLDGKAVAYLVNFVTADRVMYYQGAYHGAYRKFYAGGVLHFHAIQQAWQAGIREYDFMIGGEDYKAGWTTGEHGQHHLCLMPDTLRGRAAFSALVAPRWFLRQFQAAHTAHAFTLRKLAAVRGYIGGGRHA